MKSTFINTKKKIKQLILINNKADVKNEAYKMCNKNDQSNVEFTEIKNNKRSRVVCQS